ncbi:MAG: hypothetical protein RLZZ584_3463 [Pseudomonadota bacterium]
MSNLLPLCPPVAAAAVSTRRHGPLWRLGLCLAAVCLLGAASAAAAAAARVTVDFIQPERYSDASDSLGHAGDPEVLQALRAQIETSALACLGEGQTLSVQVLDVDLAGDYEWWHRRFVPGVRVLRERDWPRIELNYHIASQSDGTAGPGQHEVVSDMAYLSGARPAADGPVAYERAMLARWVQRRVCAPQAR